MANEVTAVELSIHVRVSKSNVIKVEDVLTGGSGTLSEALQGGQSTFALTLTSGTQIRPLKDHEMVFVNGMANGEPFTLPGPLETSHTHEPWKFHGKFGSTGP